MNFIKSKRLITKVYAVITILFAIVVLTSCGTTKYNFLTSTVVPAAEGSAKVKKDKNSNYNIDLSVIRLADPGRLNPPKNTYIVWMETEQNGSKNIGQLKTSSGMFTNTLKSSLKTVTPLKPTSFFITAEDNEGIQYPTGQVILRTQSY